MENIDKYRRTSVDAAIGLKVIAYWFWAISIARLTVLTFLFFQDRPKMATFLAGLTSAAFAFVIIMLRLAVHNSCFSQLELPKVFKWIMLYGVWNGLSLGWTFADSFGSAFGYWAMMLGDVLIVIAMFKWGNRVEVAIASLKGLVTGVFILDLVALVFAAGDENGRLGDPEFIHPNTLGHYTALGALVSLFLWQRAPQKGAERKIWGANSVLLCWMLIRTLSKTSIIGFAVAGLFSILMGSNFTRKAKLKILLIAAILMLATYGLMSRYLNSYLEENAGDVTTLTGRTLLWIRSGDMILERPLTGYGILSFRNYGPQFWDIRIIHAHNEWITQAFQLGLVGVILAMSVYWSYYRHFKNIPDPLNRKLGISVLVFILIEGVASAEPVGLLFPLPLMALLILSGHVELPHAVPPIYGEKRYSGLHIARSGS